MTCKNILITGATSGIGLALLEQYVQRGDKVIACGRTQPKLNALRDKANKLCLFDMTNAAEVEAATKQIESLDIVILNAGDCKYIDDAKHFDGKLFSDIINTNLTSMGALLQFLLPKVTKGGQVVFISSSATIVPFPRSEAYGASKAGMDYLANSLRIDLANDLIDVTLIHPGFVKTPLTDKNTFEMPFIITSDEAATRIIKGVDKRKSYIHFPKRLTFLLKLFSFLPSSIWQTLITRKHNR